MIICTDCTGCGACSAACKFDAIEMVPNAEGFLTPVVDDEKCVGCGMCQKTCPQNLKEKLELKRNLAVYAVVNKDKESLLQSSSGGAFFVLAQNVIKEGGIVCGCVMNEEQKVIHTFAENMQDLENMRGSKYVQSNTCSLYNRIKAELVAGRKVLFSGTPCQVAGIYQFLGKDYENLLTIDLICHGVTSPKALEQYINYEEKKREVKIQELKFRSKEKKNRPFMLEIQTEGGRKIYLPQVESWYYYYFLKGVMYRECCYSCQYATQDRIADITLGDFWGAEKYYPIDTSKGISAVLINSEKGARIFEDVKIQFECIESDITIAKQQNQQLSHPSEKSLEREPMMELIRNNSVVQLEQKFKKDIRITRIKYYIKCLLDTGKRRK